MRKPAEREEILIRKMIADYLSYRAAVLQKDGYMTNLYYGSMNNRKHRLISEFGRTDAELQVAIANAEAMITRTIKKAG
ncbi:MAG: hypothetical protein IJV14_15630 [Lachnospiraceae bacterium]|nr:hypothetical protein [Lachnospiraceae bacterium]